MTVANSGLMWVWPGVLLLSVAVLVWGLALLRRAGVRRPARRVPGGGDDMAGAILTERLARGAIDQAEYEQRRRVLDEQ
ncbi:SHOCT domain-containing protein [Dermatophilaceae bacterium Sec6.4]